MYAIRSYYAKTIHDFSGFPEELYRVQYPAPGNPALAEEIKEKTNKTEIGLDYKWGLDHGAWSVIKHMYPEADVRITSYNVCYTKLLRFVSHNFLHSFCSASNFIQVNSGPDQGIGRFK